MLLWIILAISIAYAFNFMWFLLAILFVEGNKMSERDFIFIQKYLMIPFSGIALFYSFANDVLDDDFDD